MISVIMLLLAILLMWPYGYYILLRWVVCLTAAFIVFVAYNLKRKVWMFFIALIALFFNPLVPVHLDKETWVVIDLIVAVVVFISIWFMKDTKRGAFG